MEKYGTILLLLCTLTAAGCLEQTEADCDDCFEMTVEHYRSARTDDSGDIVPCLVVRGENGPELGPLVGDIQGFTHNWGNYTQMIVEAIPLPAEDVVPGSWRKSTYRVIDVLEFGRMLPKSEFTMENFGGGDFVVKVNSYRFRYFDMPFECHLDDCDILLTQPMNVTAQYEDDHLSFEITDILPGS